MLTKKYSLKKKKDFARVFKKGKGQAEKFLILKLVKNNLEFPRIGLVVSKKISKKATLRNKIKRRLREGVRANLARIKPGYDLIFSARKGIEEKSFWEVRKEVEKLLQKAKLLKNG
ncbi:ribonuclease P protein component [bacterium]|nr:ribonuclease P protein component [bacterium]